MPWPPARARAAPGGAPPSVPSDCSREVKVVGAAADSPTRGPSLSAALPFRSQGPPGIQGPQGDTGPSGTPALVGSSNITSDPATGSQQVGKRPRSGGAVLLSR